MIHLAHTMLFAGLLSGFFAHLLKPRGRRLRFGLVMWGALVGGALLVDLLMYPFS